VILLGAEAEASAELVENRRSELGKLLADLGAPLGLDLEVLSPAAQVAFLFQSAQAIRWSRNVTAAEQLAAKVGLLPNRTLVLRVSGLGPGLPVACGVVGDLAPGQVKAIEDATALAAACGWAPRITDHLGLTVLTGDVQFGDPIHSSTNPNLWQTVHLDLVNSTVVMARDLVHEATHTALNTALDFAGVDLDKIDPRYYSPWKQERRPAFGFIHSIVSFVTVVDFLLSTRGVVSRLEGGLATRLADDEVTRLKKTRDPVSQFTDEAPAEALSIVEGILRRYWELVAD